MLILGILPATRRVMGVVFTCTAERRAAFGTVSGVNACRTSSLCSGVDIGDCPPDLRHVE